MKSYFLSKKETSILKGYAILMVVVTHGTYYANAFYNIPVLWNGIITTVLGNIGVGLFLFMSGYGLFKSYKKHGLDNYWKNRFKSVFLPMICVQLILFFISTIKGIKNNPVRIAMSIVGIDPSPIFDGSMWYISLMIFWYFIFYISFKLLTDRGAVAIQCVISIILIFFAYRIWAVGGYCIIHFPIGVLISYIEEQGTEINIPVSKVTGIVALIPLLIMIKVWEKTYRIWWPLENIYVLIGGLLLILIVKSYSDSLIFNTLSFLGRISYMMYLIEMRIIIYPLKYILDNYSVKPYGWVVFVILFSIGTGISYFMNIFFNRINKYI